MLQIKHLTAPQKMPSFQFSNFCKFFFCKLAVAGENTQRPPAPTENYCESKQTYFSYSLENAFHLPEAKLFFTRN